MPGSKATHERTPLPEDTKKALQLIYDAALGAQKAASHANDRLDKLCHEESPLTSALNRVTDLHQKAERSARTTTLTWAVGWTLLFSVLFCGLCAAFTHVPTASASASECVCTSLTHNR